ncbi:hypothetical protein QPK31_24005 [Massilia sp. YIM B02769]|uniref:hypothetical protein n=1 Tax=Massilia sp. YIM B02769 TaxID=3050129 RepID=UPI0025B65BBB|nr:hypothetical protein [Massilia sp. YIM B02769]MDN4061288.1 hypothetical protein [Massilia sp. YIM B02769]
MRPAQYRDTAGKAVAMAFIMSCLLAIPYVGAVIGAVIVLLLMVRISVDSKSKLAHAGILFCTIFAYLAVTVRGIIIKAEILNLAMTLFIVSFVGLMILARGGVEWYKGD